MTSYAVAHLHHVEMGPDIVAYLEAIDATLAPFGGKFMIHGGAKEHLEGAWPDRQCVLFYMKARPDRISVARPRVVPDPCPYERRLSVALLRFTHPWITQSSLGA